MEPENVADYARVAYWDSRYKEEPTYDWFSSVYGECVSRITEELWTRFGAANVAEKKNQKTPESLGPVRILHLGTGNSRLVHDLAISWYAKCREHNVSVGDGGEEEVQHDEEEEPEKQCRDLVQVAVDYSAVVIENMKQGVQPPVGPKVEWLVADVRDLSEVVPKHKCIADKGTPSASNDLPLRFFDVVIDKGTMDAIQADKESDTLDEDIDAMLQEASRVLKNDGGVFLQVTWEVPYFRKHWVMREEYGWKNDEFKVTNLNPDANGDALYRILRYVKRSASAI